jgi:fluoroquinolone transport system permease protein
MSALCALWANDLRSVIRDRTVAVLLFVPPLFAAALRFGLPLAEREAPFLAPYRELTIGLFCLLASAFPGFMLAFLLLDERDEGLFAVFRVLPISPRRFLLDRLALATGLSFLYPLLILAATRGLSPRPWPVALLLAALCALLAPLTVLLVVVLAENKIVGMAVIKGLFPLLMLPIAGLVLDSAWAGAFGLLPSYWVYRAFTAGGGVELALTAGAAAVFHLALVAVLLRRFRERLFA